MKAFPFVSSCPQESGYASLYWKGFHIATTPYNTITSCICFSLFFFLSCPSHFLFYLILFLINFRIQIFFLYWLLLPRASMPYSPPGLWFGCWQPPALIYCWWRGWVVAAVLWVPSCVISQNHTKALPQQGLLLTNPSSPFSSLLKREN